MAGAGHLCCCDRTSASSWSSLTCCGSSGCFGPSSSYAQAPITCEGTLPRISTAMQWQQMGHPRTCTCTLSASYPNRTSPFVSLPDQCPKDTTLKLSVPGVSCGACQTQSEERNVLRNVRGSLWSRPFEIAIASDEFLGAVCHVNASAAKSVKQGRRERMQQGRPAWHLDWAGLQPAPRPVPQYRRNPPGPALARRPPLCRPPPGPPQGAPPLPLPPPPPPSR